MRYLRNAWRVLWVGVAICFFVFVVLAVFIGYGPRGPKAIRDHILW